MWCYSCLFISRMQSFQRNIALFPETFRFALQLLWLRVWSSKVNHSICTISRVSPKSFSDALTLRRQEKFKYYNADNIMQSVVKISCMLINYISGFIMNKKSSMTCVEKKSWIHSSFYNTKVSSIQPRYSIQIKFRLRVNIF